MADEETTEASPEIIPPEDVSDMFPEVATADFDPIKGAKQRRVNPINFSRRYGKFIRNEILKNYGLSKDIAMNLLDTELRGLEKYTPAAAALKRKEIALDNSFNQAQRTKQLKNVMPEVYSQLSDQAKRAEAFASGRAPDSITDRALELGIRSQAADRATAGGFGAGSSVARKASDLLSAQQRVELSRYGDQLLTQNIGTKANLYLAPTEYSAAGSEIRVTPEVSASRLAMQELSEINAATLVPTTAAMSAAIQQRQFNTSLRQRTREFNASGLFEESKFNAAAANQFALTKFGYEVGYAGAVAGAANATTGLQLQLAQQGQYQDTFQDYLQQSQQAQQAGAIAQGTGATLTSIGTALTGAANLMSALGGGGATEASGGGGGGGASGGGAAPSPVISTGASEVEGGASGVGGGVNFPSASAIPDGYVGVASNADGTVNAVPVSEYSARGFSGDTGISLDPAKSGTTADQLMTSKDAVFRSMSVTTSPQQSSVPIGSNYQGRQLYSNEAALKSDDISMGRKFLNTLGQVLDPTGALSEEDASTLEQLGVLTQDAALLTTLGAQAARGDAKGFTNTMLNALKKPAIDNLAKDPKDKAGLSAAFTAYNLAQNWNQLSSAQKSMGLASLGIQVTKFAGGKDLASIEIPKTKIAGKQALTVGDALGLASLGYNIYTLTDKWDQMTDIQKLAQGAGTAAQVAQTAQQFGLLGAGKNGAAVAGVTAQKLGTQGFKAAPNLGVGAATAKSGTTVPSGYSLIYDDGAQMCVAPTANAGTATGAMSSGVNTGASAGSKTGTQALLESKFGGGYAEGGGGAGGMSTAATEGAEEGAASGVPYGKLASGAATLYAGYQAYQSYKEGDKTGAALNTMSAGGGAYDLAAGGTAGAGAGLFASGAYTVYKGWGTGGKEGAKTGLIGGSAMCAGLALMGVTCPIAFVGVAAISMAGCMVKTGKNEAQNERDAIRENWRDNNFLVDKEYNVTLADGSAYNIGVDGHGGTHKPANPDMLTTQHKENGDANDMRAYDIDYTNDLDYAAGMGGMTFSRLVLGGKETNIDQIGGQLGNAAIGNIGYGKEMSKANFETMAANMRGFYSRAGIGSKADMYQLANQALADGRLNESDHMVALQTANMLFDDNGFDTARKLMAGRQNGIQAAHDKEDAANKATSEKVPVGAQTGTGVAAVAAAGAAGASVPAANQVPQVVAQQGNVTAGGVPNASGWVNYNAANGLTAAPTAGSAPSTGNAAWQNAGWKGGASGWSNAMPVARKAGSTLGMSKEEIQALNRSRYAQAA